MSYKALYRKYRPLEFNDVVGQDHIILTLKNIIESGRISHAYLFTGPRGTGKTTVAHIFANEINKTASGRSTENPLDIIEIDAASNNGVAEVRNIIENGKYAPASSKYKVYIIDEVHMMTKGAFNALLKTLEEPPKHLVFILATTEPHKLPVTILSRTQRFNFRKIDNQVIENRLKKVLDEEKTTYDEESLKLIAKLAKGGMRDALSIADQVAAYGNNAISFVAISQVFGVISTSNQIKILNLSYEGKIKELLSMVYQFIDNGVDIERFIVSLIDILKDFIIFEKTDDLKLCETLNDETINELNITTEYAYSTVDVLIKLLTEIKFSDAAEQLFELAMLKISKSKNEVIKKKVNDVPMETEEILLSQEVVPKDKVEDVLATQEIKVEEQNDPIINVTNDEADISSFEHTQELILNDQEEHMVDENVEQDILSTQEIPLNELNDSVEETSEIDLVSYFQSDKEDKQEKVVEESFNEPPKANELINYLLNADRDAGLRYKNSLNNVVPEASSHEEYANLIKSMNFISSGEEFIIFASEDEAQVAKLNGLSKQKDFLDFIYETFGKALNIIGITKNQFTELKTEWAKLSSEGNLPEKTPIKKVKYMAVEKTDAHSYGESLFGDIFK